MRPANGLQTILALDEEKRKKTLALFQMTRVFKTHNGEQITRKVSGSSRLRNREFLYPKTQCYFSSKWLKPISPIYPKKKIDIWRSIEMELRRAENQLLTKLTKSWKKIILCESIKESDDNHCCLGKGGLSIVFCRSSGMTCTRANNNTTAHKIDWNQREK